MLCESLQNTIEAIQKDSLESADRFFQWGFILMSFDQNASPLGTESREREIGLIGG